MQQGDPQRTRWSDAELEKFHADFLRHDEHERARLLRYDQLYEAVFRKEDRDAGAPPGLLQLCSRMSGDLTEMKIANDRQKRFVGGVVFAFTSMAFFLTDSAHKLMDILKRL
jgi:hypothetical protein